MGDVVIVVVVAMVMCQNLRNGFCEGSHQQDLDLLDKAQLPTCISPQR